MKNKANGWCYISFLTLLNWLNLKLIARKGVREAAILLCLPHNLEGLLLVANSVARSTGTCLNSALGNVLENIESVGCIVRLSQAATRKGPKLVLVYKNSSDNWRR